MEIAPAAAPAICPACSAELPSGASFCPRCGSATPTNLSGGGVAYRPADSGADAARHRELQRLLGDAYELRGLIGRGGFADVFEAWDIRLKRPLAIKTLRADLEISEPLLERFRREAEAIARLRHPNIMPIYAVGGEGNVAFFVMPKIDGESLASRLQRESTLDADEAGRILSEAASALSMAHDAGLIHRDVKPENIMLDGPQRRVLVTDFGIAKNAAQGEGGLTGTGMMIGTPHYMSPEQAMGERSIDHRSDQYSLAVVGYRMLAGRLPFEGESLQQQIFRLATETPPALTHVAPAVPAAVADVIQKGLAKDARERFGSMAAFQRAIEAATSGAPIPVGRRIRVEDLQTRVAAMRRALPGWMSPVTLGALALGALGAWLFVQAISPAHRTLAANREEAVFTARSFLVARGVQPPFAEATVFEKLSQEKFRFLYENAPRTIDQRATTDVPVWHWHVKLLPDADQRSTWHIEVGPGNRILGIQHPVADTARAPTVSVDAAQAVALRELSARVGDVAALERMADSSVRLPNRLDHIFRWRRPASAIVWKNDTVVSKVNVRVRGDEVSSFGEEFTTPRDWSSGPVETVAFGIILVVILAAAIALIWLLAQQLRQDELQWRTCLIFGAAIMVMGLPTFLVADAPRAFVIGTTESPVSGVPPFLDVIATGLLRVLGIFAWALAALLVESIGAELRPRAFAGITELTRGHFRTPEFVTAVAVGGLCGLALLAALGAADFAGFMITGAPPTADLPSDVVTAPVPALQALETLGREMLPALGIGVFQLGVLKLLRSERWAFVIPLVTLPVIYVLPMLKTATTGELVHGVLRLALLSVIVWRYGVLAGGVAGWLSVAIPSLAVLFAYSRGSSMGALLAAAVYATPFVLAIVAHRRLVSPQTAVTRGAS